LVARDGIEPPTPAFSGLRLARLILLNQFNWTRYFALKSRV
jgi:hypothetical protein